MNLEKLKEILEETGLPVAYESFPENGSPGLPFICYMQTGKDNFSADGEVYHSSRMITVELYTKRKDEEKEILVENALKDFFWNSTEGKIDTENCYMVAYNMEV